MQSAVNLLAVALFKLSNVFMVRKLLFVGISVSLFVSCSSTREKIVKSVLQPYVPPGKLTIALVPQIMNCVMSQESNRRQTLPLGFNYEIVESAGKLIITQYKNEFHQRDLVKSKEFEACTAEAVAEINKKIEFSQEEMEHFHQLKNLNYSNITVDGIFLTRNNVKVVMTVLQQKENKVFTRINSLIRINSTLDLNYLYHYGADVTWFACAKNEDCVAKEGFCDSYAVHRSFSAEADQFLEENIKKKYQNADCPVNHPKNSTAPVAICVKNTCVIER